MKEEKIYIKCPFCGKKLFRIEINSKFKNIYLWCKNCKREIKCDK